MSCFDKLLCFMRFCEEAILKTIFSESQRIIKWMCFCCDFAQIYDFDRVYRYGYIHFSILAADNTFNL